MAITQNRIISIVIIFLIISVANGCYNDSFLAINEVEISDQVSFNNDIIPIFNKDCNTSGCHNTGGQKPDLSPSRAYLSLTNGNYIDKENPENSEIYQWMKGNRAVTMPLSG